MGGTAKTYPQLLLMHVVIFWKIQNILVKIRTPCLSYRRGIGACLKDHSVKYIGVREIQPMLSKHPSKLKMGIFCIILTLSNLHHCDQLRCRLNFCCGLGSPFVVLYAQFPENPLGKYISIQDILDGNKEYVRCGLFFQWEKQDPFLHRPFLCLQHALWIAVLPHVPGAAVGT